MKPCEAAWLGQEGDTYTDRNNQPAKLRESFLRDLIGMCNMPPIGMNSILEIGANRGLNLEAIHNFAPNVELHGVEINEYAAKLLKEKDYVHATHGSFLTFKPGRQYDLVMTCGVLIHLHATSLPTAYKQLYDLSSRNILIAEYFSPTEKVIEWRGTHLFSRDYGSGMWDAYPDLQLVNHGFLWERMNPAWDNLTWFLFKKVANGQTVL